MAILTRIFGTKKPGMVDPSRVERVAASQTAEDFARPVRAQVYREATITLESGYTRKGIVLDYTETGLRIRFPTNESLPRFLILNPSAGLPPINSSRTPQRRSPDRN